MALDAGDRHRAREASNKRAQSQDDLHRGRRARQLVRRGSIAAADRIPEAGAVATIGAPADPAHVAGLFADDRATTFSGPASPHGSQVAVILSEDIERAELYVLDLRGP